MKFKKDIARMVQQANDRRTKRVELKSVSRAQLGRLRPILSWREVVTGAEDDSRKKSRCLRTQTSLTGKTRFDGRAGGNVNSQQAGRHSSCIICDYHVSCAQ